VPIAGLALLPLILDWPLLLSPVHIVFLELIIDPACSIALEAEPEETDLMARPPRDPNEPLFGISKILSGLSQGWFVLLTVLMVFGFALYRGQPEANVRSQTFTTLVIGMLALIIFNRSRSRSILATLQTPNPPFWWVAAGALVFLAFVLYATPLAALFRFASPTTMDLAISLAFGLISIVGLEIARRTVSRRGWQKLFQAGPLS
jgi:P-type Ca2+ transporter type 2C